METLPLEIAEVVVLKPRRFADERGWFFESFNSTSFQQATGVPEPFVQDNHSRSTKGVLRGLHYQLVQPQDKLVWCIRGRVWDVAVDIDPCSPTYREHVGVELSDSNHRQVWVPPGYAHGFCVLSESADFHYKCTDYYDPVDEGGILWNDPDLNIEWPVDSPLVSEKDQALTTLISYMSGAGS